MNTKTSRKHAFVRLNEDHEHEPDSQGESIIREMAAEFGVSLRALRFYESRKLLGPRREGKVRIYGSSDRQRLRMILKGKQFGFTLTEIGELMGARDSTEDFENKLQPKQIESQIDHLRRQRQEIDEAIAKLLAAQARLTSLASERQIEA